MESLLMVILVIVTIAVALCVVFFGIVGFMTLKISNKVLKGMDGDKKW